VGAVGHIKRFLQMPQNAPVPTLAARGQQLT